jgi:hypothetical protein
MSVSVCWTAADEAAIAGARGGGGGGGVEGVGAAAAAVRERVTCLLACLLVGRNRYTGSIGYK